MEYRDNIEIEAKLFLNEDYPRSLADKGPRGEKVWEALTLNNSWYTDYGICGAKFNEKHQDSLDKVLWLGDSEANSNWNEMLPENWSKGMHLNHGFHYEIGILLSISFGQDLKSQLMIFCIHEARVKGIFLFVVFHGIFSPI
jgi:hypothetical protein